MDVYYNGRTIHFTEAQAEYAMVNVLELATCKDHDNMTIGIWSCIQDAVDISEGVNKQYNDECREPGSLVNTGI